MKTKPEKSDFSELRKKAEKELGKKEKKPGNVPADGQMLFYELETHRVELEMQNEELRRARQELEESHRRYADLYDFAPIGYFVLDRYGVVSSVNLTGAQIVRRDRHRIVGVPFTVFVVREDHMVFFEHLENVFRRRTKEVSELRLIGEGAATWHVRLQSIPVEESGREPKSCRTAVIDITEHKRMEEEVRRFRDELEIRVRDLARTREDLQEEIAKREQAEEQLRQAQKMESIGTLAGGIAHDLNNVLAPIVINSELALLDMVGNPGVRNYLELVHKSGLRGRDLVKQLLLFSRKSEKKAAAVILTPLVKNTFKFLRASLPVTIEMNLHLEADSDTVYGDPSQVQQVIVTCAPMRLTPCGRRRGPSTSPSGVKPSVRTISPSPTWNRGNILSYRSRIRGAAWKRP